MTNTDLRAGFVAPSDPRGRLQLTLRPETPEPQAYFQSADVRLSPNAEAAIAAALLPAMQSGRDLVVEGPVSKRYLEGLDVIQDIYHSWQPPLQKVHIEGVTPVNREPVGGRVGLFFSGGVDSFYSLLKHADEITDLIFIRGFELRPDETAPIEHAYRNVLEVAARLGMRSAAIETDLRWRLVARGLSWGQIAGGPATASVGLLLYPEFSRLYIAASDTYARLHPWASHPYVDPLWSTEGLVFIHDGCEASRVEKVRVIAQHDWALKALRVCMERPMHALNCGRCEKCIRTMLTLLGLGALEHGPSFDVGLDPGRIRRMPLRYLHILEAAKENLQLLEAGGKPRRVRAALRTAIHQWERRFAAGALVETLPPAWRRMLSLLYRILKPFGVLPPKTVGHYP